MLPSMSKAEKAARKSKRRRPLPPRPRRALADPGTSIFLQLLALLAMLVGKSPLATPPAFIRPANMYEKGEGGTVPLPSRRPSRGRYRTRPTYRQLVADLHRPAARAEAEDILRRRVPPEALPWLDEALAREQWWMLATVARPGLPDDLIEERMLQETLAWTHRNSDDNPQSGLDAPSPRDS